MQHDDWRSFIFKSPEVAKEWLPKLEAMRAKITPGDTEQSVDKLILMDYDRAFALDPEPHVVVAGCETTEGDEITLEDAKRQMFQMSDGGLNSVATCSCGYLRGNYNLNSVCPKCGSKNVSLWDRVIGYLTKIKNWSKGRQDEQKLRVYSDGKNQIK